MSTDHLSVRRRTRLKAKEQAALKRLRILAASLSYEWDTDLNPCKRRALETVCDACERLAQESARLVKVATGWEAEALNYARSRECQQERADKADALAARYKAALEQILPTAGREYGEACRDGCDVNAAHDIAMDAVGVIVAAAREAEPKP